MNQLLLKVISQIVLRNIIKKYIDQINEEWIISIEGLDLEDLQDFCFLRLFYLTSCSEDSKRNIHR